MVDISSQNNKINVTVSSSGNTANTNVTPDYAQYYSEKSKEWAISNRIVDNTDYSSKYYANESKKQADISTAKATEVIESGNTAVSNIESARDNAIVDVNTAGATQVALATEQATIATNKTSEVVASGNTALANITTAKNNAITSITNQETTSKNNVIATGNAQVERVNLTGVDNRTPIFSKSEIGTNEGVYKNVYDLKHSTFDLSKFTIVGSPTITDDGVASGFSSGNYVKITQSLNFNNSWEITQKIKLENTATSANVFLNSVSPSTQLEVFIMRDNYLACSLYADGKYIATSSSGKARLTVGLDYICKLQFTGDSYIFSYSENGINFTKVWEIPSTVKVNIDTFNIGYNFAIGSIDLKQFSITAGDKEAFNGNKTGLDVINDIEIPYTLSKTGSKIVDEVYRDRVIDLYEQQGQAGYYTIDEENKNFTLPMGEIYGMIEQKGTYHPPLLSKMWSDHLLNDMSWLRADTFSWQDGTTYSLAYNELLSEYNNSASTTETEGSITFKHTPKGYKIALATQETAILNKYTADGIAWYYILDTTNKKFKLPRIKYKYWKNTSTLSVVGNGMTLGLSNGSDNAGLNHWSGNGLVATKSNYGLSMGTTISAETANMTNNKTIGITTDPTKSGLVADVSSANEETGLYLYFYVGEFTKSAEAQTAGLKAELLNVKLDISNIKRYPIEVSDKSLMPSWYVVYNDGWCEQGGSLLNNSSALTYSTTFLKPFRDNNYTITTSYTSTHTGESTVRVGALQSRNNTGFSMYIPSSATGLSWQASGYIS